MTCDSELLGVTVKFTTISGMWMCYDVTCDSEFLGVTIKGNAILCMWQQIVHAYMKCINACMFNSIIM